ncbi:hypothetical protein JX265_005073 [Neoarthrinium moseri]|uniref:Ribonuclease H n=1 Tax=Neoarthrinium moseri TaxID=1658444 RepID=A0A9P9WP66_9PEZI|nr:uncharacterized protein JN550_009203 [Neoarthrinium moseri]KAI1842747.1 hypothetical protein JX266_011068 [Neoarthrinium moseri]KAI1863924.1 hypothetical protein JN550_009203 [Neoarthrinium moseri]KAI1873451.1 hypothetical protein JX265_005073 [Neoarthrinium moseri]
MPSTGKKRKADEDVEKFYAVRAGKVPGVYKTWAECQEQISGFKGAQFKKFETQQDAEDFAAGKEPKPNPADPKKPQKFYAVAIGTKPGIYTDWTEAQKAYQGTKGPKYQSFKTREDAIEFMRAHGGEAARKAIEAEVPVRPTKKSKTIEDGVLHIYTDGSSLSNGRAGAVAGVGVYFGPHDPRNVSERLQGELQTNQRAELTAFLRAMNQVSVDQHIRIFTDSKYSIDCVTNWYRGWQKNDWMTSQGESVKNKDLVQAIRSKIEDRELAGSKTMFDWVKGHSVTAGNVEADKLAVAGAKSAKGR